MKKITLGAAILAAGQGTRLKMSCPKPLAPALGLCLVDYSLMALEHFYQRCDLEGHSVAVTGHQKEVVEEYLRSRYNAERLSFAWQREQRGTADALRAYFSGHPAAKDYEYTAVICADTPLIGGEDLEKLYRYLIEHQLDAVAATFHAINPHGYGRIVRNEDGGFHIVEEKDASAAQKAIKEVNSGLYIMRTSFILQNLDRVDCQNKSGEFYLTDLFQDDRLVAPVLFPHEETFIGVNTLGQLEQVTTLLRQAKCQALRAAGVRMLDASSLFIDWEVQVGASSVLYPNVILEGATRVGERVVIGAGSIITDSVINSDAEIKPYTVLEEAMVGIKASVGPFARLRPGADIGEKSKIGNFVEIKKSKLHHGVKVSHLSYVGDAEIGDETNIGCGFITCNYDGVNKHRTEIGKNCFIGSDSQTIAPVKIGDNCFVASSTTITQNLEDGDFAISRGKQITKAKMASRFLKTKKE